MTVVLAILLASAPVAAMQRALDASAEWTMERRIEGAPRPLVSKGIVRCKAGEGIVWETRHPFASSVTMTTNAMIFVDEDGRREKSLDELPHYAEIRQATDAFAAGDTNAFGGVFDVRASETADGGWRLTLRPEVRALEHLLTEVEMSGARLPTNVVLRAPTGVSVIRFRERTGDL